jgi:hypothetical protein
MLHPRYVEIFQINCAMPGALGLDSRRAALFSVSQAVNAWMQERLICDVFRVSANLFTHSFKHVLILEFRYPTALSRLVTSSSGLKSLSLPTADGSLLKTQAVHAWIRGKRLSMSFFRVQPV